MHTHYTLFTQRIIKDRNNNIIIIIIIIIITTLNMQDVFLF